MSLVLVFLLFCCISINYVMDLLFGCFENNHGRPSPRATPQKIADSFYRFSDLSITK